MKRQTDGERSRERLWKESERGREAVASCKEEGSREQNRRRSERRRKKEKNGGKTIKK